MSASLLTTRQSFGLFAVALVVLGATSFVRTPPGWQGEWDGETTMLVTNSVYRKVTRGWAAPMGYPFDFTQGDRTATWYSKRTDQNYYKQFGLPVYLLAAIAPRDVDALGQFLLAARYVATAAGVVVAAALITLFARRCGMCVGLALLGFVASDWKFGTFLHSLYWVPWLSLLPLAEVMAAYSPGMTTRKLVGVLALFAVTVFTRALCGYEHISVPVLTACAGVVICGRPAGWRVLARDASWFVVVGGLGVAAAILTHFLALYFTFGSVEDAIQNTVGNALSRSLMANDTRGSAGTLRAHLFGAYGVLAQHKLLTVLMGAWGLALAVWSVWSGRLEPRVGPGPRLSTLGVASVLAFLAACSWIVLMRVHVAMAPQYNGLLFFLGFVWFAVPFVTAVIRAAVVTARGTPLEGN